MSNAKPVYLTTIRRPLKQLNVMPGGSTSYSCNMPTTPAWVLNLANWRPSNLDIGITGRCNLRCKFCYLGDKPEGAGSDMSLETAELVVKYVEQLCNRLAKGKHIAMCMFGGEPFLNFEAMRYIVEECDNRKLPTGRAVMTNGATATPDQIEWVKTHRITPKRSSTGCPESANITRPGSYLERYHAESAQYDDYSRPRRITVTPETAAFSFETVRYFHSLGYYGMLDFSTDDYADWSDEQIATHKMQLTLIAREIVRQRRLGHVLVDEVMYLTAKKAFDASRVMSVGCGAGWGLQAITWDGYIMPCHRMLNEPRTSPMCGGHLSDILAGKTVSFGQVFIDRVLKNSRKEETPECFSCGARQTCQHGCSHVSWIACNGDLNKTPRVRCEMHRHYHALAHWIHSQLKELDPEWFNKRPTKCAPIGGPQ